MSRLRSAAPGRWFRADPSQPHLPTLVRSSGLYRYCPRPLARRAELLLRVLALRAPMSVSTETLGPLCALAQVDWLRPAERFEGQSLRELIDYLLRSVRYPLPEGLYALVLARTTHFYRWIRSSEESRVAAQLLRLLGTGGSVEDACRQGLLPPLTRTERHALWVVEPQPNLQRLVMAARVQAAGGPGWLTNALINARVQPDAAMLRWFVERAGELGPADVGPVVDWVRDVPKRFVPWSGQRVLREVQRWHQERARRLQHASSPLPALGPIPRSPFQEEAWEEQGIRWEMKELRSGQALHEEGRALRHCVATYHAAAAAGQISLWSLRREGERALTVEILHAERSIVQARGLCNRLATSCERTALESWARRNELVIRPGVFR